MCTTVLEAHGIAKQLHPPQSPTVTALQDCSFSLQAGHICALVGPDGSGKTTLLKILSGLIAQDEGKFFIRDLPWESADRPNLVIGYMPQKFGLYEDLSVQENLDLYADLRGLNGERKDQRLQKLLEMIRLDGFRERLAGRLSGGMKQKLALACTLIVPPDLLLLDEPTVGVDPLSKRELWDIIEDTTAENNVATMVSTSYLDEAERCPDLLLLSEGKILAQGKPEEIKAALRDLCCLVWAQQGETVRTLQENILPFSGLVDMRPQCGALRCVAKTQSFWEEAEKLDSFQGRRIQKVETSIEDSFMLMLSQRKTASEHRVALQLSSTLSSLCILSKGEKGEEDNKIIVTEHLTRCFGSFTAFVSKGEILGLLGPNGAGKTTTFRMLFGLLPPSSGSLSVAGEKLGKAVAKARSKMGYVAQKFSLYTDLTVQQNLSFFAGIYGLTGKYAKERMHLVCEEFGLRPWLKTAPSELSGGWKQSLAMAVGLLHEPEILFLDKATSGADPRARRSFWRRILSLANAGVLLASIQVIVISSLSVTRERKQGTFDQILVSPLHPIIILMGKILPAIAVGLIQSGIVFLLTLLWFKIPFNGSVFLLFFSLALFNFALVGLGVCISVVTSSIQQAMLYSFSIIMPISLLSGFLTPLSSMPKLLQSLPNPLRYAVDSARRIYLAGDGLELVYPNLIPLFLMGCISIGVATALFRKKSSK